jgi:hypothetical protein
MRLVYNEMIQSNQKICIISDHRKGIKTVFNRPHWDGSNNAGSHTLILYATSCKKIYKEVGKLGQKNKISNMISNVG